MTLNGSSVLDILQSGGYNPAAGTTLTILTAGAPVSGTFGALENATFDGGAEVWEVEGWVTSYAAIANGDLERVSDAVERIAGHAPRSLATLLLNP